MDNAPLDVTLHRMTTLKNKRHNRIPKGTFLKIAMQLLVLLTMCDSTLFAQAAARGPLEGVWKVTDIVVTGAGAYSESAPQPSVFIFAKNHYSLMWVPGHMPRTLFKTQVPTAEEKVAAFDSLVASSGTYELSGSTITFRFILAKGPNAAFINEQFSVDGDVMTLTWVSSDSHQRSGPDVVRSTLPVSTTRMKLIRVE
jgi:hypothetical protein